MRQQHGAHYDIARRYFIPCSLALGAMLGLLTSSSAAAAPDQGVHVEQRATELLARGIDFIVWAIVAGYRAAPALMLGLAMLVAVPAISIVCWLYLGVQRRSRLAKIAAARGAPDEDEPAPTLPGHAFVEMVGPTLSSSRARFAILNDMLRIGREEDNDVRIAEAAVHRYHAAILREDFGCYRITDLSGGEGNGVRVNGQPCEDVRLRDGDLIELGSGRLRFHAGLV